MSFENKVLSFKNLYDEISAKMPLIVGKAFKEEYIHVDFKRYNKCTFANCTLVFEFGVCSIVDCDFNDCKFKAKQGSPSSLILHFDKQIRESAFRDQQR